MKNILYISLIAAAGLGIYTYNNPHTDFTADKKSGIQFYMGSWKEAMEKANKENKIIFLDIYATWCGPCKRLKSTTFSDSRVGKYFNTNFINVTLDGETGDGEILAEKHRISGYPTLLFINKEGNVVASADGFMGADELLQLGRSALK